MAQADGGDVGIVDLSALQLRLRAQRLQSTQMISSLTQHLHARNAVQVFDARQCFVGGERLLPDFGMGHDAEKFMAARPSDAHDFAPEHIGQNFFRRVMKWSLLLVRIHQQVGVDGDHKRSPYES